MAGIDVAYAISEEVKEKINILRKSADLKEVLDTRFPKRVLLFRPNGNEGKNNS